jgi:hypothetical protein
MPDVNTGMYQPLIAPQQPALGPLQVLQLIGQLNQNKLFEQTYNARQAIGKAYENNTLPNGDLNAPGLRTDIGRTGGFLAGEGLGQATQNSEADVRLKSSYAGVLRQIFGQLSTKAVITPQDIATAKAAAAAQGVPGGVIQDFAASIPRNSKEWKDFAVTQSNLARGPEAIAGGVTVPAGPRAIPTQIPEGQAARIRASGGLQTGTEPGFAEAQTATGAGSGAALNEARHRGLNYRQEVFPLEAAIPALEKLGKTGTGPGTEEFNHIKSFLQSAGIPGLDVDKIKNFDEAKKYLTDFVNQNGNTGTNDKLAAAFAGNPSVGVSNAAAVDVAKSALALRRMKQAQLIEFEKSGLPDSEFAKWASRWQIGHDPRAFGFDLMSPEARKKVIESFPEGKNGAPGARDLFKLQVQEAHKAGIINPNGLGQ